MAKIIFTRGQYEITKNDNNSYWAFKLPFFDYLKNFTDFTEARIYINNLVKQEEDK